MNSSQKVIILGGGLWGGLLAYHLAKYRSDIPFEIHEKESSFGGNHTWSFHQTDLSRENFKRIEPFIAHSWNGYDVSFPDRKRSLYTPYHSLTSEKFHQVLIESLSAESIFLSSHLSTEEASSRGEIIIDARNENLVFGKCGYQKFLGLDLELSSNHEIEKPILMDACVEQVDGYRFLYYLPWEEKRILVEDTRYSSNPYLDQKQVEEDLMKAISFRGWMIQKIHRKESGVLPIPIDKVMVRKNSEALNLSGIFHDVTGYSLPDAMRLIQRLLREDSWTKNRLQELLENYRLEREEKRKFFRFLNRLLFEAARRDKRYQVLQHFYRLPEPIIERFYAGELKTSDLIQIFIGKPPVKVSDALRAIFLNQQLDEDVL